MADVIPAYPNRNRADRRQFLKLAGGLGVSLAGMGLLEACGAKPVTPPAAGGALETTTIRIPLSNVVSICTAPQYVAKDLLTAEGFTNVQYVPMENLAATAESLSSGETDMLLQFSGPGLLSLDAGKQITFLAGIHVGCFVLFGSSKVREIRDLKGTTIAVSLIGGSDHVYLASILANVGIDPNKDVEWATRPLPESKQLFIDGKIDAFLAFPPMTQELRDRQIGHVIVDSMMDKPWSQYFCCLATMNRDFVLKHPVATKAALRALLKATDVCALDPERASKFMVDNGFATNYTYTLEMMREIPYNRWRVFDPTETIRFYALLLHGAGLIKGTPDQMIQNGANWRFLNELKAEMPATPVPAGAFAATRSLLCAVDNNRKAGAQRAHTAE